MIFTCGQADSARAASQQNTSDIVPIRACKTHAGEVPSAIGVFGTNTGAERCSAPISDDSALLSFNVGVVIVLHFSGAFHGRLKVIVEVMKNLR